MVLSPVTTTGGTSLSYSKFNPAQGQYEVQSFTLGASSTSTIAGGSKGSGAGKPNISDLTVESAGVSSTTSDNLLRVLQGKVGGNLMLQTYNAKGVRVARITIGSTQVLDQKFNLVAGAAPEITTSYSFTKIGVTTFGAAGNDKLGSGQANVYLWDLSKNQSTTDTLDTDTQRASRRASALHSQDVTPDPKMAHKLLLSGQLANGKTEDVPLTSADFDVSNTASRSQASKGSGAGKATVGALNALAPNGSENDLSDLFLDLLKGTHLKSLTLTDYGAEGRPLLQLALTNAITTSDSFSPVGEALSFNYQQLKLTVYTQDAKGAVNQQTPVNWNVSTNKST